MKFIFGVVVIICVSDVLGNTCPRTNQRPGSECIDECQPSIGCSDPNKECLCDGDCGYSCVKKSLVCSVMKKPRNGRKIGKDRRFNATIKFVCDPNYTLFGASTRTCRAKGLWDGRKTRCKISCPDPGIPSGTNRHRKKNPNGFSERTTLRYNCLHGYDTSDALNIRCQKNGQWSSSPPVCKIRQCGRVTLPANSLVRLPRQWKNKASHQLGTRIFLMCQPGYRSVRSVGIIQCRTGGWSQPSTGFACYGRSCGDPGTPRNGKRSGLSFSLKDVVRYSCDSCYKLTGASYRQCLADGSWSDTLPVCTQITCPTPSSLTLGTVRLSSQPIYCGSFVDYTCSIGYNLVGSNKRTCLGDGSWSGNKPVCEIVDCGNPGDPRNGLTTASGGFTYGNDVTFSCNYNYVLEGSLLATCQNNGKWSKNLPVCLEKCSDPSRKTNADVHGNEFYHGKEVQFSCTKDYTLVPASSKKLTCQDGDWTGTIPSCKAPCPPLQRLSDGYKRGRLRTHGSSVELYCARYHQLVGSSRLTCNDGTWSNQMPRCLAKCPQIQRIANGWVDGNSYLEGDTLSFRCERDYVLDGELRITCNGNRRWSHRTPACKAPCAILRSPAHGRIIQQGFRHNENIEFECDPNYYLQGRNVLTCTDGRWNANPPTCLAPCKQFDARPFAGGYIKRNGFKHNEEVTFGCNDPYVIDGRETLRCDDGAWSDKLPICGGSCRRFVAPANGEIRKDGFKHKETVRFRCNNGFQMVGNPNRLCNFGVWNDHTVPRCEARCSDPSKDSNTWIVGNNFYNGKKVEFRCPKDYVLEPQNSQKLICENGRWNGTIPRCKAPCGRLGSPAYGRITQQGFRHNENIEFECDRNYYLEGRNVLRCSNGKWNANPPACLAPCPRLPEIRNGNINVDKSLKHNSVAIFSCNDGYQQVGPGISQCLNGKWRQEQPRCLQKCSDPSGKTNAKVIGDGNAFYDGEEVKFVCSKKDFVLYPLHSSKLLCQDGNWSKTIPSCKAPCTKLRPPGHGRVTQRGFRHDENVQFECYKDYKLHGRKSLTCSNGKWSDAPPVCLARINPNLMVNTSITTEVLTQARTVPTTNSTTSASTTQISTPAKLKLCREIPSKGKLKVKGSGLSSGSKRTFSCSPAKYWEIWGAKEITCLDNGKWNAPSPTCNLKGPVIDCPVVKKIKGGIATRNESFHGGRVVFECNQNYIMTGRKRTLCKSGKWLRPVPKCLAPCIKLSEPVNGFIQMSSGNKHGGIITFKCNRDYTIRGPTTVECNNGSWNDSLPVCTRK